jgi:hypothetical protein
MKITGVAAILAVATADMVSECRDMISSTEKAWATTCQHWCDVYTTGGYLSDKCETATTAVELVSCILQYQNYCINTEQPSSDPETDAQLVKGCEDSITSQNPGWVATCQDFCKDFVPGKGRSACSKPITDGPSMAACVGEIYHYCVPKTA